MSTILITLGITFIVLMVCLFFLGFSWFLTGKSRFRIGMCGKVPKKRKNGECGTENTCPLCHPTEEGKQKE